MNDDPVAMQTEWVPLKPGGASFRTHNLVESDSDRLEFRASRGAMFFYLIFFLVGMGMLIGFAVARISTSDFGLNLATILPMLAGLTFAILGGCMAYFGTAPIVFDKREGAFWKGRKSPDEVFNRAALKHFAELDEIYALQLISEYCRGNKTSYHSYELNLVLKDGTRIHVVDHGDQNRLRKDAETLATFLNKSVWDGDQMNQPIQDKTPNA